MANFTPSKKTAQDFNGGVEYVDQDIANNVQGDTVNAETVNSLVESALYTQEYVETGVANATQIANSAKTTAAGALSQVEQVLGDKTLLPDVIKNYYNLGAFDTYVSNGDGTGIAGRKTGNYKLDGSEDWFIDSTSFWTTGFGARITAKWDGGFANIVNNRGLKDRFTNGVDNLYFYEGTAWIFLTGISTVEELRRNLAANPIYIQYELASEYQYTEKVIENQPIRFLDQAGEMSLYNAYKNGGIVGGNFVPLYTTTDNTSPAEKFGGDWESKGNYTTSDGTVIYVWRKL